MIRNGARVRHQQQLERERRERERQAQITHVKRRWKPFSYPIQAELQVHLSLYGVLAADHATSLLERMHQEQQRPSPASLLSAPLPSRPALSREQLAQQYGWNDFPPMVQDLLSLHYTAFSREGDHQQTERDVSSVAKTLRLLLTDPRAELGAALAEHQTAFGAASMADVATIAARLSLLLEPTEHQQE